MAKPFVKVQSTGRGMGQVLRRRGSITLESIEDLLADASTVRVVTAEVVAKVCAERGVDLRTRLGRGRRRLYHRYLQHCFEDKVLSSEERADLAHLREILQLPAEDLRAIHDEVAIEVDGDAVHEVLADYHLDDGEAEFLWGLREDLGLSDERAEQIYRDAAIESRDRALSSAVSRDHQFIERHAAAGNFTGRSTGTFDDAVEDALAKAALAIPKLHWFEVTETAGYVENGRTSSWHVTLRAGIHRDE